MNPGRLNKKVIFKRFVEITDGSAGFVNDKDINGPAWETVCETWANVNPTSAREFIQAASMQVDLTHKVIVRYRTDVDRSMIIVYNGRRLDIQHIINIREENRYLEIICTEQV